VTATIPFGLWVDLGLELTAQDALGYEVEAVEDGIPPRVLCDAHCDLSGIPHRSSNIDAIAAVRSRLW